MNFSKNFKNLLTDETKKSLITNLNLKNDRTIRNYINGTRTPNLEQLIIIKQTLNCTYEELLEQPTESENQ